MNELTSFGAWLKRRRKALDLTQDDLAQRVGVAIGTVRKWEADERRPAKDVAARLAEALEVTPDEREAVRRAARAELSPERLPAATVQTVSEAPSTPRAPQPDRPNNLPVQRDPLIGRQREVAEVVALLRRDDVGLVTLTGPGGTGKTRLALQIAADLSDDFPDGVWFVDLAPIGDPSHVAPTLAASLGVKETSGEPLVETLKRFLREQTVLLLLDNFEHVVASAPILAQLLSAARALKLLVTSRVLLQLSGEQEYPVPPLALPEPPPAGRSVPSADRVRQSPAVELFIRRSRRDMRITDETTFAVAEICTRLDGLPLPIELAAARTRLFSPPALLQRLDHPLNLLTGGAHDAHARQQTLRNTIAWSYDLLDAEEQRLFRRLAVFVGGCTLEAVEAVCSVEGDLSGNVLDGLASLMDKSLLRQIERDGGEPRFRMLETIREYAQERLLASGEEEALWRRHASYILALVEAANARVSTSVLQWMADLAVEYDNVRAVLGWLLARGEAERALRLMVALSGFWERRGYRSEGRTWLETAFAARGAVPASLWLRAVAEAGTFAPEQGDGAMMIPLLEEALTLSREVGDKRLVPPILSRLAWTLQNRGDYERAAALCVESLVLCREQGTTGGIAWSLQALAHVALEQGDFARASPLLEESLRLYRQLGHSGTSAWEIDIAWALDKLALVALYQAEYIAATQLLEESLALFHEQESTGGIGCNLYHRSWVALDQGAYEQAPALLVESLQLLREAGDKRNTAFCLEGLAQLASVLSAAEGRGRLDTAQSAARAARLFGAAAALRDAIGIPLPPVDQVRYKRYLDTARAQLDEAAWALASAEGRAMTLEQAVAYALEGGT